MSDSSRILVKPVDSQRLRRHFLRLPFSLYEDDPVWVPPILASQRQLLGWRSHPFHDQAESCSFLAFRGSRVVGRITAIVNHVHLRVYQDQAGFFGFFESEDDGRVASALLHEARDWLKSRGCSSMRGPVSPSTNYECGLLVQGFDAPPVIMMTYNPPYYERLLLSEGFRAVQDLYAYGGQFESFASAWHEYSEMGLKAMRRFDFELQSLNIQQLMEHASLFFEMYNQLTRDLWGCVPLSAGEQTFLLRQFRHVLIPELAWGAGKDDVAQGIVLALPDINPIVKRHRGRLFPFGALDIVLNKKRVKTARVICALVDSGLHGWGLGLVLLGRLALSGIALGMREVELGWIAESNRMARVALERGGFRRTKVYRIYETPV